MNNRKISLLNDCVFKTMFKESSEFRKLLNKIFKFYFDFDLSRYNLTSEELEIVDLNDIKNNIKDERVVTHNLYLGKFKKIDYNTLSDIEKDLALLNCDNLEEMKVLAKSNSTREKIMSEFKRKITNEEFLEALFDPEIEEEMILNSEKHVARDEGHAEGLKEASINIAKSLLSSGMDIKEVSKHTNLSIDEIEKLENQK